MSVVETDSRCDQDNRKKTFKIRIYQESCDSILDQVFERLNRVASSGRETANFEAGCVASQYTRNRSFRKREIRSRVRPQNLINK
jgi:hypothetical protein